MPTKYQVRGMAERLTLLLGTLFLLFAPTLATASPQHFASFAKPQLAAISATSETQVIVTTSADTDDGDTHSFLTLSAHPGNDNAISLREALLASNNITSTSTLTIAFNIPQTDSGYSSSSATWQIRIGEQALPALSRGNLLIDGSTQPGSGSRPRVVLDGFDVYEDAGLSNGLTITSASNTIRALTLMNFYDDAVLIAGANAAYNAIVSCYLGPDASGTIADQPSYFGVELRDGAHDNVIGGAAAVRNLIAGNAHSGILIQGADTRNNIVAGNWIGVTPNGQVALPNVITGVLVSNGAYGNQIGGAGQGNLISGNETGISIDGAVATQVTGNIIGLAANGHALGNTNTGVVLARGAHDNMIGGTSAAQRNIISGNGSSTSTYGQGIYLFSAAPYPDTTDNIIQGNYIGVDSSGNAPVGNRRQGVLIGAGAQGNQVGGTDPGAGNVIAYNGLGGLRIESDGNAIAGNLIGVGADGSTQLGNQFNGIRVTANNNTIGPSNLIAYNQQSGILVSGSDTAILTNTLLANERSGLCINGANTSIRGNQIEGNGTSSGPWAECAIRGGIVITGTNGARISDNVIRSNQDTGVTVYNGVSNTILSNSISENSVIGIQLASGGNNDLAPPQLLLVTASSVSGAACARCQVEFFTDTGDQGRTLIGATTATDSGTFSQALTPAAPGTHLTATHTDSNGNTSAFAPAVPIPADTQPSPTPDPPPDQPTLYRHFVPIVRQ